MTTTTVLVELFSTGWIEINEYLDKWNRITTPYWWKFASTACVSARACRERDRSLNGSRLQELSIKYLRLYVFGNFHHALYFTWYDLEIQYLHLKTESRLLTDAFVCNHQVLSEQFDEPAVICTGKDGLGWVTKLEYIYPEKQQDNSEKDNGSKHMEGMVQEEGMLDELGIVHWMSLPNTPTPWTTSVINCTILLQEICFRASQCYKCWLLLCG